jgi:hypothetical protein
MDAKELKHCRWCQQPIVINEMAAITCADATLAAWIAGFCSALHQSRAARADVKDGLAWWQRGKGTSGR